jgi:hypothetical protein
MTAALLFLDLDGVLHAHDAHFAIADVRSASTAQLLEAGLFAHSALLADLLAPYPDLQVLVHSSWRKVLELRALRDVLGPLGPRVMGVTPLELESREASIEAYLRRRRLSAERLVILDDQPSLFTALRDRVVTSDSSVGIASPDVQRRLEAALDSLHPHPLSRDGSDQGHRETTIAAIVAGTECLTPTQLGAGQAETWMRRRQVFAVERNGTTLLARFQFDDQLQPLPVIGEALAAFGPVDDPWAVAAWFHYPNAWLVRDGRCLSPRQALDLGLADELVRAASKRASSYVA